MLSVIASAKGARTHVLASKQLLFESNHFFVIANFRQVHD